MDRIQLTRVEAVALLLLTGPGVSAMTRKNLEAAKKQFPGFRRVLSTTSQTEIDNACYRLVEIVKPQLAKFNEELVNKERLERERAAERAKQDLFYKNVTGLLKKVNDTAYLTGTERLQLAATRYPEADIRLNRLSKLEYFGRKPMVTSIPAEVKISKSELATGFGKQFDSSLAKLLKDKLNPPAKMPAPDKKDDFFSF